MKQQEIDQFFKLLNRHLDAPAEVIVIGASAGSLMGHIRPSLDIDFEIRLQGRKTTAAKKKLQQAIETARQTQGIAVNYSENVGGWSLIDYLDYRKTAAPYKRIGKLTVKLIAPAYWTIGKMARYLELDVQDMAEIIKRQKLKSGTLIKLWARAVNASDLSLELGQFRKNVETFLDTYARHLWGKKTDPEKLKTAFRALI